LSGIIPYRCGAKVPKPFGKTRLIAFLRIAGILAMLVRHIGGMQPFRQLGRNQPIGSHLVRISALSGVPSAPPAEGLPVLHPVPDAEAASISALRDALLHRADPAPPGLEFGLDHQSSLHSGEAVTTWMLHRFDLARSGLLETNAIPVAARVVALLDRLDQDARFRPAEA